LLLPSIRVGSKWGYSALSELPSIRAGSTWGYIPLQAQPLPRKVESMDRLQIERIGGIVGFGGPHLKSRGEVALSDLSPADRQAVESLFANPQRAMPGHPGEADAFRYRITRQTATGTQTIEVPGNAVPAALRDSVRDVLE
jgi:hypothetical protein